MTKFVKTRTIKKLDSLGEIIRKLREDMGLPLRTVASYVGIDQAILSKIERGIRKASRKQVVKLAKYLKVREDKLIIAWLSDKLVYAVENEEMGLKALQVAEEKVAYKKYSKIGRQTIIKRINDYFSKDRRISKAWLFGSFARGEEDYKSDLDLMIEVPTDSKFTLFDLADIQYQLQNLVPKKVDIVMNKGVKPHFMERIKPDLQIIYERQPHYRKRKA